MLLPRTAILLPLAAALLGGCVSTDPGESDPAEPSVVELQRGSTRLAARAEAEPVDPEPVADAGAEPAPVEPADPAPVAEPAAPADAGPPEHAERVPRRGYIPPPANWSALVCVSDADCVKCEVEWPLSECRYQECRQWRAQYDCDPGMLCTTREGFGDQTYCVAPPS